MTIDALLARLDGVHPRGPGKWVARCSSHKDSTPSLSITQAGARILLHCFSRCDTAQIVAALGLSLRDLFTNAPTPRGQRPTPKPVKIDRVTLPFRFEMGALDRRLRAERVMQTVNSITMSGLDDNELDRLIDAAARAYADIERAELLEGVADGLRAKAFARKEGTVSHAA